MRPRRAEVLAVHKQKLEEFLRELELWKPLIRGELSCIVCETTITIDNIGYIIPSGKDIIFCCSNPSCVFKLRKMKKLNQKNES